MSPIRQDALDRLADYTAGVLDPDETLEIERLITSDPDWAAAHSALVAVQPLLTEQLAGLPVEPMPTEVAARLDRLITDERRPAGTAEIIPIDRHRRWPRLALGAAAAVVVVAAGVAGITALNGNTSSNSSSMSAPAAGTGAKAPAVAPNRAAVPTTASGTDYTHDTLTLARPVLPDAGHVGQARDAPEIPDALQRLAGPTDLNNCLSAITAAEGGRVTGVDFARYQGQPALVVSLTGGAAQAVAVGPDCGLAGDGAALLDSVPQPGAQVTTPTR